MNRVIVILILCLFGLNGQTAEAQTKRTTKKTTASATVNKAAQNEKRPVVIAVEDGKVYVDLLDEAVVPGDRIVVYKTDGYFVHPVTKERIARDVQDIAELQVEKVFSSYVQTVPKPSMVISQIKPGMTIRKREQERQVQAEPVAMTPVPEQPQLTEAEIKEQQMLDAIVEANKMLPSKKKNNQSLLEITVDGKTICYHHLVTSKMQYKMIKKSMEKNKFYNEKTLNELRSSELYRTAGELGYIVKDRWWNPDKKEHLDYTIVGN